MRRFLDILYRASEWLAAASIGAIFLIILAQVLLNTADKLSEALGGEPLGVLVPSYAEFAAYLLAAASFLALAGALNNGAHVRVYLLLHSVPPLPRRVLEFLAATVAALASGFFAWRSILMVWDSYRFNDLSYGLVSVPMWIPQTPMAVGLVLLAIAFTDYAVARVRGLPLPSSDQILHAE